MKKLVFILLVFLQFSCNSNAQMTTRVIRDSLFIPWELVYGPDNHIWFAQKNGYVCRMEPQSGHIDTLYYESNTAVQGEGGMLGMALDPGFPTTPYIYIAYNYGSNKERIVKYTYANNTLTTPQILLDNIAASNIHNGCRLLIVGDKLFATTGDASNQSLPQNVSSVNGKVLRINLDGSIPPDNPLPGSPVWTWGHRNAQGLIYENGKMYSSEHGPSSDDEINIIEKGRNYGWPAVTGFCNTPAEITFCNDSNVVEPMKAWTPTIAVSDIAYYNHAMFPSLQNSILMTTLKDSKLHQLTLNGSFDSITASSTISAVSFGRLRAICIGTHGNIFIATSNSNSSGSNRVDKIIEVYDPSFVPPPSSVPGAAKNEITIYPNPITDEINVDISSREQLPVQYRIINTEGRTVLSGELSDNRNKLKISHLPAGGYMLNILKGNNAIAGEKIVKQ